MDRIVTFLYNCPLYGVGVITIAVVLFWAISSFCGNYITKLKKLWKGINIILWMTSVIIVLYFTLLTRTAGRADIQLIPFYSFIEAKTQPMRYWMLVMNVFLFVPFGLTMPFALPDRFQHKIFLSVLLALLFSIIIEIMQGVLDFGRVETDDVICNTLGSFIGTLSYWLGDCVRTYKCKTYVK